ncbi:hypothetical protein RclHR1_10420005 [Rhizophagus clarus]|uniref:MYND-type domain-containing protein n=1 Tax=Rhizophagus clarus TaxID=94130 RepID=A0A2Z6Q1J4_9GLOM|nr:hypothetical protein RclHR1_10420005 [Rhizophagus clarus]
MMQSLRFIINFSSESCKMECSVCKKPTNQRCSRCQAKYYCSTSCQRRDYPNHVLDCPLRSADILVKNALNDLIPSKMSVRYEYGFCNCKHLEDESKLIGLYIGLIEIIGCNANQLHSWWESGTLSENIKRAYDDKGYTSNYYKWFLKNEHVLQGLYKYEEDKSYEYLMEKHYFSLIMLYLSERDLKVPFNSFPRSKRNVCAFYLTIITGRIPIIEDIDWIDLGFCSCKFDNNYLGKSEERRLGDLYRELIVQKGCKIDEFHDAYLSGSIGYLLERKCGSNNCNWLSENKIEIRGYCNPTKSVYHLKQYALSDSAVLQPSVDVDYGFVNCRTEDERRQLKHIYRKLIKTPQFETQDLHEACLAGKIFDYVKSILPNEMLKSDFFKNPYP